MFDNEKKKIMYYLDDFLHNQKKTIRCLNCTEASMLENVKIMNYITQKNLSQGGGTILEDKVKQMQQNLNKIDIASHEKLVTESLEILKKVTFIMNYILAQIDDNKLVQMKHEIEQMNQDLIKIKDHL